MKVVQFVLQNLEETFGTTGKWTKIHLGLLIVRLLFIALRGYPHPDEFFQSPEIAAADVFNFSVFIPWEFSVDGPGGRACRSIVGPLIGSGISYTILVGLSSVIPWFLNAYMLLLFPRIVMFGFSLIIDYVAAKLALANGKEPGTVLCILSTSWTMALMHTRPFSNILESIYVACALWLFFIPLDNLSPSAKTLRFLGLGAIFSLGIFTRFTYLFFFFPIGLGILYELYSSKDRGKKNLPFLLNESKKKY
jgi:phosphatidylinositol glycan class Z